MKIQIRWLTALVAAACASTIALKAWTAEGAAQSPSLAKEARVFEMRTYYAAPGKLEALHARFRDHTNRLFKKHGIQLVGYWVPADKDRGAENTLIYVVAFPSREAARQSWQAFGSDPEWRAAREASEVTGRLVERVESVYMHPTDYSPIK